MEGITDAVPCFEVKLIAIRDVNPPCPTTYIWPNPGSGLAWGRMARYVLGPLMVTYGF